MVIKGMDMPTLVVVALGLGLIVMYYIETDRKGKEAAKSKDAFTTKDSPQPPVALLDYQFDKVNFPSNQYSNMFFNSTPWLHGRGLGDGKVMILRN